MKKVLLSLCVLFTVVSVNAQSSIESVFRKYSNRSDYVSFSVNGGLAKLLTCEDDNLSSITGVRIIALKDDCKGTDSFYEDVINHIDTREYEELMKVNDSGDDVLIYVRCDKDVYKELLVVVGGDDNALIQIKGSISADEAEEIASDMHADMSISMN